MLGCSEEKVGFERPLEPKGQIWKDFGLPGVSSRLMTKMKNKRNKRLQNEI